MAINAVIFNFRNALLDLLMVKLPYVDKKRVKQIYATAIPNLQVMIPKF